LLLRHCLGWDRAQILLELQSILLPERVEAYWSLVEERATRIPLQYLTHTQEFFGRPFVVSPAVLIPRPETEILVETVLRHLAPIPRPLVVDVGTGSGCIAVTLAAERADARIIAIDVSPEALGVARENAWRTGVLDRISLCESDLLSGLTPGSRSIDAVVSNPPYVDASERGSLMPEVRDHEPASALFPPGEALSIYRRLAPEAAARLAGKGLLAVEVGLGQSEAVAGIFESHGFVIAELVPDLEGIPRVVVARKRP
jgi:release factor glutamine methyltransferase